MNTIIGLDQTFYGVADPDRISVYAIMSDASVEYLFDRWKKKDPYIVKKVYLGKTVVEAKEIWANKMVKHD